MRPRIPVPILLLLTASGLLSIGFAWLTPVGEAPDEAAHLGYVRHLATAGTLPRLDLSRSRQIQTDTNYEAHQPPLYYVVCVPAYAVGRMAAGGDGGAQACRFVAIVCGLAGTLLVWRLACVLAPGREWLAVLATGFAALLPMRLAVQASVSNDSLAEALATGSLLLMAIGVRDGWSNRRAVAVAVVVSAAFLARQANLMLAPPLLVALYLGARGQHVEERKVWAEFLRASGVAAACGALLCGWWLLRNRALYGDVLGQAAFNWYFADTTRWQQFRDELGWSFGQYLSRMVIPTLAGSFWGAFGHLNPDRPELWMGVVGPGYPPRSWLYPVLNAALIPPIAGAALAHFRARKHVNSSGGRGGAAVVAVHALFVLAVFINFNATYFQAQGRYLFPAIGGIAGAFAGGWLVLAGRREREVALCLIACMCVLAIYALFGVVGPAFATATGGPGR